jgi:hypothetical protein
MPTSGSTQLFKAVREMVPYMKETPHRKRAMLLMTDGVDNSIIAASREAPGPLEGSARAQAALREGEVLLYALGVNVAGRAGAVHVPSLKRLAEPTSGPSSSRQRFARWKGERSGWPKNCVNSTPWGSIRRTPATGRIDA